jgi:hypothetical protein
MSIDYVRMSVRQTIPAECLAPIERWLLTHVFAIEEDGGALQFHGSWTLSDILEGDISADDELPEALAASCKICPELGAEVKRQLEEKGKIFRGSINYEKIFQSIIRRHPDRVPHVSIEEFDGKRSVEGP